MVFSEKLTKLFALTEIKSSAFAEAIHIDPSQISRMKTGSRGKPTNIDTLRQMADCFASCCASDYRKSSLSALTGDERINNDCSERVISDIIFSWLCSDSAIEEEERTGRFLQRVDGFSLNAPDKDSPLVISTLAKNGENKLITYYDNRGKREAVRNLFEMVLNSEGQKELYLFTDESTDWIYEDPDFANELAELIHKLAKSGCQFSRVEPPMQGLENTFTTIERWLPAYMCGAVRQYYYPHLRDGLHRRTIFAAPGKAAVTSRSTNDQRQSRLTVFCTDEAMVDISYREVLDLVRLCKPMMRVYSSAEDEMFKSFIRNASMPADGIFKTASLSIPTLPISIMERIRKESGYDLATKIIENQVERSMLRKRQLRIHHIKDIMSLASAEDVVAGRVVIPSTLILPTCLYYKPDEYCLHLQSIIDSMMNCANYEAILTDNPRWKDIILYCKNNTSVLMVKAQDPFAVFEITERRLAASLSDYLLRLSEEEASQTTREQTIERLSAEIQKIDALVKKAKEYEAYKMAN